MVCRHVWQSPAGGQSVRPHRSSSPTLFELCWQWTGGHWQGDCDTPELAGGRRLDGPLSRHESDAARPGQFSRSRAEQSQIKAGRSWFNVAYLCQAELILILKPGSEVEPDQQQVWPGRVGPKGAELGRVGPIGMSPTEG